MPKKTPNILLFAIDSLRRDHMSCYGYSRLTTPHMDRLAAEGTLIENAFSPYVPTTPGYSSMLTGRDVIATQMVSLVPKGPLDPEQPTLPELLREAGYVSTCVGHGEFYRGFDEYLQFESWGLGWETRPARKAESLNSVAIPALEKMNDSGKPWLLFMRHMDPHTPYQPPSPFDTLFYSKDPCAKDAPNTMKPVFDFKPFARYFESWLPPGIRDADFVTASYDGAVAYMDACIQQILTRVTDMGIEDETLVIITSDHGETLYDYECWFDHHGLYECTLMVPLIFYWPGKVPAGVRSQAYTLEQDLVPTILDLCGLKKVSKGVKFDGVSTVPYFSKTEETPRSEFYISECTWMRKQGWRTPIWTFWEALEPDFHGKPPVELYNIVEDPEQLHNLADQEPAVVELLRERMNAWIKMRCRQTGKGNPILDYELGVDKEIGSVSDAEMFQKR